MRAYTKPRYEPVPSDAAVQLRVEFEHLLQAIEVAWHDAAENLASMNRRVHGDALLPFYAGVWERFDLHSRAMLYLSAAQSDSLDRRCLQSDSEDDRSYSEAEINAYCNRFPRTYFQHHCDLDFGSAESYRLHLPLLRKCQIEAVVPNRVFYVEFSLRGRRSDVHRTYFTINADRAMYLDTWDYEEILALDNDGLCYYIQ